MKEKLYQELGISEALQSSFAQMEKAFQGYITGSHVPMREMYGVMTPGIEFIFCGDYRTAAGVFRR